jgi:hypothetical protein
MEYELDACSHSEVSVKVCKLMYKHDQTREKWQCSHHCGRDVAGRFSDFVVSALWLLLREC